MISIDGFAYILNQENKYMDDKLIDLRNVYKIYLKFFRVFSFKKQRYY